MKPEQQDDTNVLYLGKGQKLVVKDHFGTNIAEVENNI